MLFFLKLLDRRAFWLRRAVPVYIIIAAVLFTVEIIFGLIHATSTYCYRAWVVGVRCKVNVLRFRRAAGLSVGAETATAGTLPQCTRQERDDARETADAYRPARACCTGIRRRRMEQYIIIVKVQCACTYRSRVARTYINNTRERSVENKKKKKIERNHDSFYIIHTIYCTRSKQRRVNAHFIT